MNILIRAFYGTRNVIGPVGVLSTINLIDSLLDHTEIRTWSIMPSIIDEIGETPTTSAKFKGHKAIIASGGKDSTAPCSPESGQTSPDIFLMC